MENVRELIQLSLTPVFLLVGLASFLNVVTGRLGRVVDRARDLEKMLPLDSDPREKKIHQTELGSLDRRMRYNHWSINFSAFAALLITVLVGILFLSDTVRFDASVLITFLFTLTMLSMLIGICFFLVEVYVATRTVRVRAELFLDINGDNSKDE